MSGHYRGVILNITFYFLYCNHKVYREFVITLYFNIRRLELLLRIITVKPRYIFTKFFAHTTLRTETIYFTLSRFTAANCSEQTVDIGNSLSIIYEVVG